MLCDGKMLVLWEVAVKVPFASQMYHNFDTWDKMENNFNIFSLTKSHKYSFSILRQSFCLPNVPQ